MKDEPKTPARDCAYRRENAADCACAKDQCERHGLCCLCVASHRQHDSLPACLRPLKKKWLAEAREGTAR